MNVAVAFTFKDQLQTKLKNQQDDSSLLLMIPINKEFQLHSSHRSKYFICVYMWACTEVESQWWLVSYLVMNFHQVAAEYYEKSQNSVSYSDHRVETSKRWWLEDLSTDVRGGCLSFLLLLYSCQFLPLCLFLFMYLGAYMLMSIKSSSCIFFFLIKSIFLSALGLSCSTWDLCWSM